MTAERRRARAEEERFVDEYSDTTFFLSTEGNDAWTGRLCCPNSEGTDGPFATFVRARDAARAIGTDVSRRIIVRGGTYYDVSWELAAQDPNLSLEGAEGEEVVLYGGRRVTGWVKEEGSEFWSVSLPEVPDSTWVPRLLQVNGEVRPRARLPQEGAFTHDSVFDVQWMTTTGGGWAREPTEEELTTLKYREGDLGPWLDVRSAELTVFHAWDDSTVGLRSIDVENRVLTFANPAGHPPGGFASWNDHARTYVVWNVREGMTRPGQWYVDRTAGRLVYWPLPGEEMDKVEAIVPTRERIITLSGEGFGALRSLTIKGLTLAVTTTPMVAGGFGAAQFDGAISGDVVLYDARLEDLRIRNVAGHGIKLRARTNRNVVVRNNEIEHTGAGGIYLTGSENRVTENLVRHVGWMYPAAIGIYGGGDRNVIDHNDIYDTSYSGINGGGGTGNRIEYNDFARVMTVLNDGAAIYTFSARDLVVRGNVARDIGGQNGRHAYYLDEQSEGCVVTGNLAVGVASPVHNHMARNNRIEGNVFVYDGDVALRFVRSTGYVLSKNVVYATGEITIYNVDSIEAFEDNILYSAQGRVWGQRYRPDSYFAIGTDRIPDSEDTRQANPLFVDLAGGEYGFRVGSPALKLRIEPIDVSRAGRTGRRTY
jgi:parallel beta-helix repeat protein